MHDVYEMDLYRVIGAAFGSSVCWSTFYALIILFDEGFRITILLLFFVSCFYGLFMSYRRPRFAQLILFCRN